MQSRELIAETGHDLLLLASSWQGFRGREILINVITKSLQLSKPQIIH
jgi:hypothetical protein